MKRSAPPELTPRQARFVDEYLIDLNATQAAIRAGYSHRNADTIACQLMRKTQVSEAIKARQAAIASKLHVSQERIVQEMARLAFSTMRDYVAFGPAGVKLIDSTTIDDDAMRAVSEVSEKPGEYGSALSIKLHDKKGALDSLARHLGMFKDKTELTGKDGGPIELSASKADLTGLLSSLAARVRKAGLDSEPK